MTADEIKAEINRQVGEKGYFIIGVNHVCRIGSVWPAGSTTAEFGNCLILAEATREEYLREWGVYVPGPWHYYRAMID